MLFRLFLLCLLLHYSIESFHFSSDSEDENIDNSQELSQSDALLEKLKNLRSKLDSLKSKLGMSDHITENDESSKISLPLLMNPLMERLTGNNINPLSGGGLMSIMSMRSMMKSEEKPTNSNPFEEITKMTLPNIIDPMTTNKQNGNGNILSGVLGAVPKFITLFSKLKEKHDSGADDTERHNFIQEQISEILNPILETSIMSRYSNKEHICTREIIRKEPRLLDSHSSFRKLICEEFDEAARCSTYKSTNNESISTTKIYECCDGFKTDNLSKKNCQQVVDMKSTLSLLESNHIQLYQKLNESRELLNELEAKYLTFFIPDWTNILQQNKVMTKELLRNHLVDGIHRTYDYNDGDIVKTIGNGIIVINQRNTADKIITLANCVPINKTNQQTSNGMVQEMKSLMKPTTDTIMQSLHINNLNKFISLLSPELQGKLSDKSEKLTVFAFTDEAFDKLTKEMQEKIESASGCGKDIMESHIFVNWKCSFDFTSDTSFVSLIGNDTESISINDNEINGAKIIGKDFVSSNGILHIIDDIIIKHRLESWERLLNDKALTEKIHETVENSTEGITIFIPKEKNLSKDNILYHVLPIMEYNLTTPQILVTAANTTIFSGNDRLSSDLSSSRFRFDFQIEKPMAANETVAFIKDGQIGCSRFIDKSMKKCGAVIHFIDKPLPQLSLYEDFFKQREDISKFYNILKKSSLYSRLFMSNLFTLFIPIDDSFSNKKYKKILSSQENIDIFIKSHSMQKVLCKFDLPHIRELSIIERKDKIYIQQAEILEKEIMFNNGVIYIIDEPLKVVLSE